MRILALVKIISTPENRKEIIEILVSIKGPMQAIQGCLACSICEEQGDEGIILYMEHWRTWEDFMRHIRSDLYARMLEAMELSSKEPEVSFFEVSAMKGMELIEAVRGPR